MGTQLEEVGPPAAERAYAFCARQPERCIYHAGWIHEGGLTQSPNVPRGWLLAERCQSVDVSGLVYVSATGIVIPALASETAVEQLVALARTNLNLIRVIVGERAQVADLWQRLGPLGLEARLSRDQLVYAVTRAEFRPVETPLALRAAREAQLDALVAASAAMAREEARDDPQSRNPMLFRERIRARIARGRDFIHTEHGALIFKTNVSALSPIGGQIEGVYTSPPLRRRAYGRRGMSAVTDWVLERAARAVLLVNEDNTGAQRLYESLGYRRIYESRTIFVGP